MTIAAVQSALNQAGYACQDDGDFGPMTYAALASYASDRGLGQFGQALGVAMAAQFPATGVTSDLQRIHWLAQAAHETGGFRWLIEQGDASYFVRYERRPDLGNVRPGDGYRYRGRGLFQITGRANYARFGAQIDAPLEADPDLALQPLIAVKIACAYWTDRHIGPLADADDCPAVTRKINGGLNGLAERQAITDRLKRLWAVG